MQYAKFVSHCKSLHQKHFGGRAGMSPINPYVRRYARSYYGKAKKYDGHGWQVRIAHQTMSLPDWVRDYVICHELAHCIDTTRAFGAMHTPEFWALLRAAYPRTDEAERWLKRQDRLVKSDTYQSRPYNRPNGDLRRKYPVGTRVYYSPGNSPDELTGTIKRHSRKTVTITVEGTTRWWRIPWRLLDMSIIEIL